jgi:histidine ammonia-lyase
MKLHIDNQLIDLDCLRKISSESVIISIDQSVKSKVELAFQQIQASINKNQTVYGVNTGFGKLARIRIENEDLADLQRNLVCSHAVGVGDFLPEKIVKIIMILKVVALSKGLSGVCNTVIERLCDLINHRIFPCIPAKGSVGASGDLAPLAHLSQVLIGEGEASYKGEVISAKEALQLCSLEPLKLGPKEGLALLNGTQVSTAIAISAYFEVENLFQAAIYAGALTVDAIKGSQKPFDSRIHEARGHHGQKVVAEKLKSLLKGSEIMTSHNNCDRVQDPYSIRCQPQVMGACLDIMHHVSSVLVIEANAVTDNPLVFVDTEEIVSGGNFHAEPVAFASDHLALAIAEIGSIAERRCALLIDPQLSGLPAFLVKESGLNSGFMIPQVTAAALVSENKTLAHPASVDSIPTSANQEDHVSMATHAANRLLTMTQSLAYIIAIEYLSAAQGIEFHQPLNTSKQLLETMLNIRTVSGSLINDRSLASDIKSLSELIISGEFCPQEFEIFSK